MVLMNYLFYTGQQVHKLQYMRVLVVRLDQGGFCQCSFWHSDTLGYYRMVREFYETSRQHTANYKGQALDKCR